MKSKDFTPPLKLEPCPCKSGKKYEACCRPFHLGENPKTALELMRSRFAGYALSLSDYIIDTTHKKNPRFCHDRKKWVQELLYFSSHTEFKNLKILDFQESGSFAEVTFFAHLIQNEKDVSFREKSYFEKVEGKWLYLNGEIFSSP